MTDSKLSPTFRVLLWDFERSSVAYDLDLLVVALVLSLNMGDLLASPICKCCNLKFSSTTNEIAAL